MTLTLLTLSGSLYQACKFGEASYHDYIWFQTVLLSGTDDANLSVRFRDGRFKTVSISKSIIFPLDLYRNSHNVACAHVPSERIHPTAAR